MAIFDMCEVSTVIFSQVVMKVFLCHIIGVSVVLLIVVEVFVI